MKGTSVDSMNKSARIFVLLNVIVAVLGIAVSIYSISHHLEVKLSGATDAICNINQAFSCDDVASSEYSELFGIPLGAYGLAFFLSLFFLSMIEIKNPGKEKSNLPALVSLSFIGTLVSVILGGISAGIIGVGCITCIAVYVLNGALLLNSVFYLRSGQTGYSPARSMNGLTTAAIVTGLTILVYSQLAPTSDPRQHPNFVGEPEEGAPTLSSQTYDIPVNLSAYSGYGEDFRKGSDQAKVTIVEFADFECPACAAAARTLAQIAARYQDRINLVFKNYPLDQACNNGISRKLHEQACELAVMARCAGEAGKFWQYHDLAFGNQKLIDAEKPRQWAKIVGLSDSQIETCANSKAILNKVKDDIRLGNSIGVQGTPSIYINGRKLLVNANFVTVAAEIEKILAQ